MKKRSHRRNAFIAKGSQLQPAAVLPLSLVAAAALGPDCPGSIPAATLEARTRHRCALGQKTPTRVCTVAAASDNIAPPRRLSMADSSTRDPARRRCPQEPTLPREQLLAAFANVWDDAAPLPVSLAALGCLVPDLRWW